MIVGDGITALAFLDGLTPPKDSGVILLGRSAPEFGRGAAYAKGTPGTPWQFAYLLNSPADDIDPAFAAWLAARWPEVEAKMAGRRPDWLGAARGLIAAGDLYGVNAPREFYGDFMREQAEAATARLAANGVRVQVIDDVATGVTLGAGGVHVARENGPALTVDRVDIAPGGPSTMRFDGDDGPFAAPSVFGYEDRIAEHILAGREIFCIGGNAAMLDVLRLCQSLILEEKLRFTALAPDGSVPAALVPRMPRKLTQPVLTAGHVTADSFLEEISAAIATAKADGDEMREIRAGFRAHFLDHPLTSYLADPNEARRVPGKLRFWLRGGTRDTIFDMHRLIEAGVCRMLTGSAIDIDHRSDGATVRVRDAEGVQSRIDTGFVVNCAGAGPTSRFDPMTQDLLDQGLIARCDITRGLRVGPGCQTTDARVRYLSPAVSEVGDEVMAMPLYDAHMLRTISARGRQLTS